MARLRVNDFRRILGYDTFKSTLFAVAVDGRVARFAGRGWGHGVGMSQWGAKGMAEHGYRAHQILEYYYPGTTFGALDERIARGRWPGRISRRSTCVSAWSPTSRRFPRPVAPPTDSGSTSARWASSDRARRSRTATGQRT